MAENEETQVPEEPIEPEQDEPETNEQTKEDSELAHWKFEARKNEKRAKENLREIENLKAENEKLRAERESAREQAQVDSIRSKVAAEFGIPADFIQGTDEDAMRDYAERMKKHFAPESAPKPTKNGKFSTDGMGDAKKQLAQQMFGA